MVIFLFIKISFRKHIMISNLILRPINFKMCSLKETSIWSLVEVFSTNKLALCLWTAANLNRRLHDRYFTCCITIFITL